MAFSTRRGSDSLVRPFLREMERLNEDWPGSRIRDLEPSAPPIELSETDDEVVLRAQVPGMKKEDLDVRVLDGSVSIRGEAKETKEESKEGLYRSEFRYGGFSRTVSLPPGVDVGRAEAKLESGVLELRLPKTEEARKSARRIEIR